jgi:hypothetical protein
MNRRAFLVVPCAAAIFVSVGSATTHIVRPDGSGDFATIQAAIDAAADGDVIELTDGMFLGPGNRDILYRGKAITVRSQSGNPDACVIDCEGSPGAPHRGFFFLDDGAGGVLEGVTVTNGYQLNGGGVYIMYTSLTIERCIFRHNTAGNSGGGAYCDFGANVTFVGCTFAANMAPGGGGFCI